MMIDRPFTTTVLLLVCLIVQTTHAKEISLKDAAKPYFAVLKKHHTEITRVTFWGVDDAQSWLNNYPVKGRTNYPLPFDRQLHPKPAFDAIVNALGS